MGMFEIFVCLCVCLFYPPAAPAWSDFQTPIEDRWPLVSHVWPSDPMGSPPNQSASSRTLKHPFILLWNQILILQKYKLPTDLQIGGYRFLSFSVVFCFDSIE